MYYAACSDDARWSVQSATCQPGGAGDARPYQPPRRVNQTAFGRKGDALQACFASLLDLDMDEVPNFILEPDYMAAIQSFLLPRERPCATLASPARGL